MHYIARSSSFCPIFSPHRDAALANHPETISIKIPFWLTNPQIATNLSRWLTFPETTTDIGRYLGKSVGLAGIVPPTTDQVDCGMHMQDDCALTLTELVEQHYSLLYRYGYRLSGSQADAEDLVQQTFLNAQTKLDQLREPDRAKSWLCVILRNIYFKTYHAQKHLNEVAVEELDVVVAEETASLDDQLIDKTALQNALNELAEEYRSTLILFYFEEFSYKEIAEQLDIPIGTVMSRLARGKSHLRKRLASKLSE